MTFTRTLVAASLALMLSGTAFAQTPPAAAPAAPAAPAAAAPAMAPAMDKKAISKACSDEADQKGLKGKPRKSFRSKCKAEKMKGM